MKPESASRVSVATGGAAPGRLSLRGAPPGMPDPNIQPPTVAATGDPFAALRIVDLVARVERGRPFRVADMVARLDASYLDWLFPEPVVIDALVQLQADWMADYRNTSGIVVADGPYGPEVTIEDSSRVDPWIVGQATRLAAECHGQLVAFGRQAHPTGDD
jgi:hypothetical protein